MDNELTIVPAEEPIEWATLEDLAPPDITVILLIDDKKKKLPFKMPSFFRVQEIFGSVPNPLPPFEFKREGEEIKKEFQYNDPVYQEQVRMAIHERNIRLILDAWDQKKLPIPGVDKSDKIKWLKDSLSVSVMSQLVDVMTRVAGKGEAQIEYRANTFHENGTGDHAGAGTVGDTAAD